MKRSFFLFTIISFVFIHSAISQGCIAIRNVTGFGQFTALGYVATSDTWLLDINNRYFASGTGFRGKQDLGKDAVTLYEYTLNFGLSKELPNGWSLAFDLPIGFNNALNPDNASGVRHPHRASGIQDIRISVYKWLLNMDVPRKGNIQLGLGLKLPTGNYHSVDYWYPTENPADKQLTPVNEVIQLGDGGTGYITNLNAYYNFSSSIGVFGSIFYLITPMNTNGVKAWPPGVFGPGFDSMNQVIKADVNSVPDNYTFRVGGNFTYKNWVGTVGLRYEGAPAHDLIGENDGRRVAGHIFSVEPGIQYKFKKSILYAFVSVPVDRGTFPTVPDKRQEAITGIPTTTGGHFADVLFYFGYTFSFR